MAYSAALNRIYDSLKKGESYGEICHYRDDYPGGLGGKPFFWWVLSFGDGKRKCFRFRKSGSWACDVTKKELDWNIRNMFGITPEEFEQHYITRSAFEKREESEESDE